MGVSASSWSWRLEASMAWEMAGIFPVSLTSRSFCCLVTVVCMRVILSPVLVIAVCVCVCVCVWERENRGLYRLSPLVVAEADGWSVGAPPPEGPQHQSSTRPGTDPAPAPVPAASTHTKEESYLITFHYSSKFHFYPVPLKVCVLFPCCLRCFVASIGQL